MRSSTQIITVALVAGISLLGWSQWGRIAPLFGQAPANAAAPAGAPTGAGGSPNAARGGPGGPVLVEVTNVSTGRIIESLDAVGNTRAFESVTITAKVSGNVEKISFTEGQQVEAGAELVRLDEAEKRADFETARAMIATAQSQREETMQKFERAQALRRSGAGTEAQVADLTLQLRTAETNITAAQARERSAMARLDDLVVRAPFAGRVGLRQVSLGALVDNKMTITTLDDVSQIRLDFAVPETLVPKIAVGAVVEAQSVSYPGRKFKGSVSVIDTRIDPVTRSAKLMALIDNKDGDLKPGMFMNVLLQVAARENAVLVPEEAVVAEGPRQIAFVVKDGKIDRRVVTIGQRQEGKVEVAEGLKVGEVIVVRGTQRVRQGLAVQTKPAFPPAPSALPAAQAPGSKPEQKS